MSMRAAELISADLTGPRPGVEETLNVTGAKTVPGQVDVAAVDLVLDVGGGGWAKALLRSNQVASFNIDGVTSATRNMLGPSGYTLNSMTPLITSDAKNARILGSSLSVVFDAAGAVAYAGNRITVSWGLKEVSTTFHTYLQQDIFTIDATRIDYRATADISRMPPIPSGCALVVYVDSVEGVVFPAATRISAARCSALLRAQGAQLPL